MNAYKIVLLLIIIVFSAINSYHDIRDMKVYDYPLWAACYSGILCHMFFERECLWVYILSGMISGAFYYFIRLITRKILASEMYILFFLRLVPSVNVNNFTNLCFDRDSTSTYGHEQIVWKGYVPICTIYGYGVTWCILYLHIHFMIISSYLVQLGNRIMYVSRVELLFCFLPG